MDIFTEIKLDPIVKYSQVCHMIRQDHVIKGSCDFISRSPSSYDPAKFGSLRHSGSGEVFGLSRDLDVMMSPIPAWLVSFESALFDVPACQIWRS